MTMLSDHYKFFNTADATVLPEHLKAGETAFGPDGKVVGTGASLAIGNETRVFWDCTQYAGAGTAFTPSADEMTLGDGVTINTISTGDKFNQGGGNGIYNNAAGAAVLYNLPAIPAGAIRISKLALQTVSFPAQYCQTYLYLNYGDSNNYWYGRIMGKGTINGWSGELLSRIAGADTSRANKDFSATFFPNDGSHFELMLIEAGDLIALTIAAMNIDTMSSLSYSDYGHLEYYGASRPLKANTVSGISFASWAGMHYIKHLHIYDATDP